MVQAIVNKTQLAALLGLTKGRITQFVKAGLPVRPDGKLDLDAALAWVTTTRQCQGGYADRGVNRLAKGVADARSARHAPVASPALPHEVEMRAPPGKAPWPNWRN